MLVPRGKSVQEGARVIVDFVGLPGAGKSSLAHAVAALLEGDGVLAVAGENGGATAAGGRRLARWERLGFRIASVWANPGLVAACAPIVLRPGGKEDLAMFVNLCRRDRALRVARPKGVLLLHESSLHRLFIALALVGRSSPDVVERFVRRMTWPDALVYLEVGPAVATERVRERLERMGPVAAADVAALDAGAAWRQGYVEASENALRVIGRSRPILRLDGSHEGVARLAVAVRVWLEQRWGDDLGRSHHSGAADRSWALPPPASHGDASTQ